MMASLRMCLEPGCGRLVRASRCDLHAKRGWKGAGGMSAGWAALRRQVLAEERRCRLCGTTIGLEVDHIVNRAQGGSDGRENLQALCKRCHRRKTQDESHEGMRRKRAGWMTAN
jgi:5-methylcytosine-specific restriction protein A